MEVIFVVSISFIGCSTAWIPMLATDLMCVFDEPIEFRLIDINPAAAKLAAEWIEAATKHHCRQDRAMSTTDRCQGLKGADVVIITVAVGGLEAMEQDLLIPEKYGIMSTVGDTTGASGWSRAIRHIPAFRDFAGDIQRCCPSALVVNYSNPMAALTAALQLCCDNIVLGLCHSYFEILDFIRRLFQLDNWDKISISLAGVNHFTWVVEFRVGRQDGYKLLREKIGRGSLKDIWVQEDGGSASLYSGSELACELFERFGYLPYPGDRHISEFLSFALSGYPERYTRERGEELPIEVVCYCNIKRTSIAHRRVGMKEREQNVVEMIEGKKEMPQKSRESGAEMIRAYLYNKPLIGAVNTLNVGQIPALPLEACVETLGAVDALGVHPFVVPNVPEHIAEIIRPHAICQQMVTEGVLEGNRKKLLHALHLDPQCAILKPHEVVAMGEELLRANAKYTSI